VAKAVKDLKGGKIEFKVDKTGTVHAPVGRASFSADKLQENLRTLFDAITRMKPSSAKGQYVRKVTLSTTMGPGVKMDVNQMNASTDND
jgi:large subunit ribosomal protein L1